MSMVHKCDICGEIYGDYPVGNEMFAGISIRSAKPEFQNVFGEDEYDLCPKCTRKLLEFIEIAKNYPMRYCIHVYDDYGEEV